MLGSHYTRDGEEGGAELSISEELFPSVPHILVAAYVKMAQAIIVTLWLSTRILLQKTQEW